MLQKVEREEARLLGVVPPAQQHVESYRTANGPRQRIVAYLGQLKESTRKGIKQSAEGKGNDTYRIPGFGRAGTTEHLCLSAKGLAPAGLRQDRLRRP